MNYGKSIENYLQKIDSGNPITLGKFLNLLSAPALNLIFSKSDIQARKVSGALYRVTHLAQPLREELDQIVVEQGTDRISGAKQNRSHDYSVNGSMLLVREGAAHPGVIMFDTDGNCTPELKHHPYALLVENRQNFIDIDKILSFIVQHCEVQPEVADQCLAVFTEGNAIANALHKQFLSTFKAIYVLLDVDAGGLQIASNIISLLPDATIQFIVPKDIKKRLEHVREPADPKSIEKAIKLGNTHPQLTYIAQLIRSTHRELEQESYLDD
ncbi:hypothetical protein D210916BOD24_00430 [Alteromonas sp. D210916BOD_24]|uniref:hypothetical protein n=1 Tax=Alteromonas sp. D210916BOD_24 TaxID=3157618 RepID=UPI00399CBB9D